MPFEISQEVWTISKDYLKGQYVELSSWEFCGVQQYSKTNGNQDFLQAVLFDENNYDYCGDYYLDECFKNVEDAQRECDRRNDLKL